MNAVTMNMSNPTTRLAADLGGKLKAMKRSVATVESCTGGGIARMITAVPGSSQWFERGFVTYSNAAKVEMVGVERELIESHGAVSLEVAVAMAEGGIRFSHADYCIAVTGVAGPEGGTEQKPVGTVCFAWAGTEQKPVSEQNHFDGDRHAIREQSVAHALTRLLALLDARA